MLPDAHKASSSGGSDALVAEAPLSVAVADEESEDAVVESADDETSVAEEKPLARVLVADSAADWSEEVACWNRRGHAAA